MQIFSCICYWNKYIATTLEYKQLLQEYKKILLCHEWVMEDVKVNLNSITSVFFYSSV